MHGQVLVTSSGLTASEYEELARLTPAAHEEFRRELETRTSHLRELLRTGDPFFIMAVVQDMNLLVPWGAYYEPTNEGLETRVELVAGLLASQTGVLPKEPPNAENMQAILDEIHHILVVNLLFNMTQRPTGGPHEASLRFSSAMRWMSLRGTSFAGHAEELAVELYQGQEAWMARSFGYTVADLIRIGAAVSELHTTRRDALGEAGADAANAEIARAEGASDSESRNAMARAVLAIMSVTEAGLLDAVSVTADAICAHDPSLDRARVEAVLADLSVAVGSVEPRRPFGGWV